MNESESLNNTREAARTLRFNPSPDARRRASGAYRLQQLTLLFFVIFCGIFAASCLKQQSQTPPSDSPSTATSEPSAVAATPISRPAGKTQFDHAQHTQLKCEQCHLRKADALTPVVPGHNACISCHVREFTATGFGICANCHDGIKDVRPAVFPFPERESYGVAFSHKTHATYIGGQRRADCTECHTQTGGKMSMPGHRECYGCHKAADQFKPGEKVVDGSCGVCHLKTGENVSFKKFSSGGRAYRFKFTHTAHVKVAQCNECHNVYGDGADQVSQPLLREHAGAGYAKSCGSCHNGRRAFTGEYGAGCSCHKCHVPDANHSCQ